MSSPTPRISQAQLVAALRGVFCEHCGAPEIGDTRFELCSGCEQVYYCG
jgi:hypothetical protein